MPVLPATAEYPGIDALAFEKSIFVFRGSGWGQADLVVG